MQDWVALVLVVGASFCGNVAAAADVFSVGAGDSRMLDACSTKDSSQQLLIVVVVVPSVDSSTISVPPHVCNVVITVEACVIRVRISSKKTEDEVDAA